MPRRRGNPGLSLLLAASLLTGGVVLPVSAASAAGAIVKKFKRDPLPIYDDAGTKIRSIDRKNLPKPGKAGIPIVRSKPGFVGVMIDGQFAWLRMSTVSTAGDVEKTGCDAGAMQFAKMEEDSIDQSLGLGCSY